MIARKFITATSEDYGNFGWQPQGFEAANPGNGELVAHDLMEHICNGPDVLTDEIMAIGVFWWLRYESGWRRGRDFRLRRPEDMGWEIASMLRDAYTGNECWPLLEPGRVNPSEWEDEDLPRAAAVAIITACQEIDDGESDERKVETIAEFQELEMERKVLGWLRRGYSVAQSKYSHMGNDRAILLFNQILQASNDLLDQTRETEGCTMSIRIDPIHYTARITNTVTYDTIVLDAR